MSLSLEEELCRLASTTDLSAALLTLGLIEHDCNYELVASREGWRRGGAETYVFEFTVTSGAQSSVKRLLLKACVAFGPGGCEGILNSWLMRRRLLQAHGVETPRLYGAGYGVVIEEFIPHSLSAILADLGEDNLPVLGVLARTYGLLARLGFVPIRLFDELRSRGQDVVVIDVGEDLGPPGLRDQADRKLFDCMLFELVKCTPPLPELNREWLYSRFCTGAGLWSH